MLSRFVLAFLPRSKCLLISWLQSPSAVILKPPKIKSDTVSTVSPSISHGEMAGWHHRLNGRESELTPGDGDEQGGLAFRRLPLGRVYSKAETLLCRLRSV